MATLHLGRQILLHAKSWAPTAKSSGDLFRMQSASLYNNVMLANDLIGLTNSSVTISKYALGNNHPSYHSLERAEAFLSTTDGVNNAVAGVTLWAQLLNGSMLFKTNESGEFIYANRENEDGSVSQHLQRQSALHITGKVSRLAAKTLGTVTFLDSVNVIQLGKHASSVGCKVTSCLNLVATSCSLTESSIELYKVIKEKPETITDPENPKSPSADFAERSRRLRNCFIAWLGDMVDFVADILFTVCAFAPALLGPHGILILAIISLLSYVINLIKDYTKIG
ncbi:hypothetical protein C10C_0724 [Chlamydia serpentis]|uniref:Uncharacterized protein n=1 Tax=Chlamydia serpentis TaxID=1967782 RepID=A0A2R8FBT7_9CHLA|nr:hypothetical protein [Chlamydia serpentis]SPN73868.1 hypothetical protein C10C_0724 [Chlamydia serpentis]